MKFVIAAKYMCCIAIMYVFMFTPTSTSICFASVLCIDLLSMHMLIIIFSQCEPNGGVAASKHLNAPTVLNSSPVHSLSQNMQAQQNFMSCDVLLQMVNSCTCIYMYGANYKL